MMEGFDEYWVNTDANKRFATYTRLDTGEYTFKLNGTNSEGLSNDKQTVLIIILVFYWSVYALRKRKEELISEVDNQTKKLKETQALLIQSRNIAALGALVSGIVHEVNTPIGAIHASVKNIATTYEQSLSSIKELFKQLNLRQTSILFKLINAEVSSSKVLTSREQRKIESQYIEALKNNNIDNEREIAEVPINQNMIEDITPLLSYLKKENILQILKMSGYIMNAYSSNKNFLLAVKKVNKIVFVLKTFTYKTQDNIKEETNILDMANAVLTIYQNQLKQINLENKMTDVGNILAYPDELGQIWTNLIHNAIHAIANDNSIIIDLSNNNNKITLSISDNGVGISEEIQSNVFEPFFTTKSIGEGPGLGLGFVKRIVEWQGEEKEFISEVGVGTKVIMHFYSENNGKENLEFK